MKNKKGQVAIYITFIFFAIILICVAAILIPMSTRFTTFAYNEGEKLMIQSNDTIQGIQDTGVRTELTDLMDGALSTTADHISITTNLFKYSWIVVVGLSALVVFLYTRRLVEYGGGII